MLLRDVQKSVEETILDLVVECSGANIALKQAIEMLRPNGEDCSCRNGIQTS